MQYWRAVTTQSWYVNSTELTSVADEKRQYSLYEKKQKLHRTEKSVWTDVVDKCLDSHFHTYDIGPSRWERVDFCWWTHRYRHIIFELTRKWISLLAKERQSGLSAMVERRIKNRKAFGNIIVEWEPDLDSAMEDYHESLHVFEWLRHTIMISRSEGKKRMISQLTW